MAAPQEAYHVLFLAVCFFSCLMEMVSFQGAFKYFVLALIDTFFINCFKVSVLIIVFLK